MGDEAGDAAVFGEDFAGFGIIEHGGAGFLGGADVGEGEARIVGEEFGVDDGAVFLGVFEQRFAQSEVSGRPELVGFGGGDGAEALKGPECGAHFGDAGEAVDLHQERGEAGEVGGDAAQDLALRGGLTDQAEFALGEVAQAAVDHFGGAGRGAGGEIAGFDEGGGEAAQGGIAGDAGAGDATADDHQVEDSGLQGGDDGGALGAVDVWFWHGTSVVGGGG